MRAQTVLLVACAGGVALGGALGCNNLLGLRDPVDEGLDAAIPDGTSPHVTLPDGGDGPTPEAAVDAPPPVWGVTGSLREDHLMADAVSETSNPIDLTTPVWTVSAYVTDPSSPTGYDAFPAQQRADGTFAIPGVPPGRYFFASDHVLDLRSGWHVWSMIETDQHVLALVRDRLGHGPVGDAGAPRSGTSTLAFDVGNLAPWVPTDDSSPQYNDDLYLTNFNAGLQLQVMFQPDYLDPPVPAGVTSFQERLFMPFGVYYDPSSLDRRPVNHAIDGASMLTQIHVQDAGVPGSEYRSLDRVAVADMDLQPGDAGNSFKGTFEAPAQRRSFDVLWRHGEFTKWITAMNPNAANAGHEITVELQAGGSTNDFPGPLLLDYTVPSISTDENVTLSFGYPYPARWTALLSASFTVTAPQTLPNGNPPDWPQNGDVTCTYDVEALQPTLTIEPTISPPRAPTVNGHDAFQDVTGVGVTPTFAWQPPEMGTAAYYEVIIFDTDTTHHDEFWVQTTATSLRMPPALLQAGHSYQAMIYAFATTTPPRDPRNLFDYSRLPRCEASALLGVISP